MRPIRFLFSLCLSAVSLAPAQDLLLLPIAGDPENTPDVNTINRLFLEAVEARRGGVVVTAPASAACESRACALEAARKAGAREVIYSGLHKLGSRWIFNATVMDSDGGNLFSQRLTAASIEDMEAVTRRMAEALVTRRNLEQAATVDNITQRETEREPERRRSLYNSGVALGYLFPVGNSFSYVRRDDFPNEEKRHGYDQMIRLAWLNTWEFWNDLNLGADVVWSTPYAIGADLNLRYLFNRGDFTPFLGGGIGLHYVKADEGTGNDRKRNSGPALNAQGGMMLFRTYDVNVMLRGQYQIVFNSDVDHGPAVDVGVSFRPKEGKGGGQKSDLGLGFWGYTGLTLVVLMMIGALAE